MRTFLSMALIAPVACEPSSAEVPVTPISILSETIGRGDPTEAGDEVCIDYRLTLPNGRVVLQDEDFCFTLGAGAVILAVDEAVHGMRPRGRRLVLVPPHKHWGRIGYGDGAIPPATDLHLEITLKKIRAPTRS